MRIEMAGYRLCSVIFIRHNQSLTYSHRLFNVTAQLPRMTPSNTSLCGTLFFWLGSWAAALQMLTQKFWHGAPIHETLWTRSSLWIT